MTFFTRRPLLVGAASLGMLLSWGAPAQDRSLVASEPRVALVIGNSAYKIGPLRNPVNDADDMARALRELGFQVTLRKDATHQQMVEAINAFGRDLRKGGVGLFYFAGHGIQSRGNNFLIPVNANPAGEAQLEFDTVNANRALAAMDERQSQTRWRLMGRVETAFTRNTF